MLDKQKLLHAVLTRLRLAQFTGDLAQVLTPEAVAEGVRLAGALHNAPENPRAQYALGWLHWYRAQVTRPGEGDFDWTLARSMFHLCFISGMGGFPEPLLPVLADQAAPVALKWLDQAPRSADRRLLARTVDLCHRIVNATPYGHPNKATHLGTLSLALCMSFEATGSRADLSAAAGTARAAVDALPADAADRAMFVLNWTHILRLQARSTGTPADLDDAIDAFRAAVRTTPVNDTTLPMFLHELGFLLQSRFQSTGSSDDLDAAIEAYRQSIDIAAGAADKATSMSNLVAALRERFESTGSLTDLDAAIEAGYQAKDGLANHSQRGSCLSNLGSALQIRFRHTGSLEDLHAAIEQGRAAVAACPADHPDRAGALSNLAASLQVLFTCSGQPADLDASIEAGLAAAGAFADGDPGHAACLSNVANALRLRFEQSGSLADLDTAVDMLRSAVRATTAGHRHWPQHNLGIALQVRFRRTGARTDLTSAIESSRAAIDAIPAAHTGRARYLNTLGISLNLLFEHLTGDPADLDAAIDALTAAVRMSTPDASDHAGYQSNLGAALQARFIRTGSRADLGDALGAGYAAAQAAATGSPQYAASLATLGNTLWAAWERTGELATLDASISALHHAVQASLDDQVVMGISLISLGNAYRARFRRTGLDTDLAASVDTYARAADLTSAAPTLRVDAARAAGALLAATNPRRAADLLEQAVLLLPQVAPLRLAQPDKQDAIATFSGLAADAAALVLQSAGAAAGDSAARALGLLEAGRAVLLGQALNTRTDLSDLRDRHPELAARFVELRAILDQPSDIIAMAGDRRHVAEEFTGLTARIRAAEGFESFGLSPDSNQLLGQADAGPVVILNLSVHRSDALILTSGGIHALPLPTLSPDVVARQVNAFHEAVRISRRLVVQDILAWLWDEIAEPVLRFLDFQRPPGPQDDWPRMWWVAGGPLSRLPLHAAGHHDDAPGPQRRTALDRVVSSYTPSVRALGHARQRLARQTKSPRHALVVAMPVTPGLPGQAPLVNVTDEVRLLQDCLPGPVLLIEPQPGEHATAHDLPTKANVLTHLPGTAIAHFACHGDSDPADPSKSLLLLHDHQSDPLDVACLAPVALNDAQLAYLSACSTAATIDARLQDEAVHLVSAFQLAGFPHVIGTLWEINDRIAVQITQRFYRALSAGGAVLDTTAAAHALHRAVLHVRDKYPEVPSIWAAHIHTGA